MPWRDLYHLCLLCILFSVEGTSLQHCCFGKELINTFTNDANKEVVENTCQFLAIQHPPAAPPSIRSWCDSKSRCLAPTMGDRGLRLFPSSRKDLIDKINSPQCPHIEKNVPACWNSVAFLVLSTTKPDFRVVYRLSGFLILSFQEFPFA